MLLEFRDVIIEARNEKKHLGTFKISTNFISAIIIRLFPKNERLSIYLGYSDPYVYKMGDTPKVIHYNLTKIKDLVLYLDRVLSDFYKIDELSEESERLNYIKLSDIIGFDVPDGNYYKYALIRNGDNLAITSEDNYNKLERKLALLELGDSDVSKI